MRTTLKAVCDKAFYSENKKLNLIGIFHKLSAKNFPAIHPTMSLVFSLDKEEEKKGEYNYYIDIESPSGNKIFDTSNTNQKLQINSNGKGSIIANIIAMKLTEEGKYTATLHIGEFSDSVEFEVAKI